jgi:hypothetical protein
MLALPRQPLARFLAATAIAAAGFVACESPFEPKGDGERIPVGVVINQDVTQDSARFYSFATSAKAAYAVYLQALEGSVWLRVLDSTGFYTLVNMTASPVSGLPRLEDNAVSSFGGGSAPNVYKIIVQQVGAGTTASFRFKIDRINTNPELVFPLVRIGDTVTGETIDPKVDVDRFVMMGTAGEDVVVVGETPAPIGSGSVAFSLVDTAGQGLLGYVFADAGPPTLTSGRMRLPATRAYALYVGSVTSNVYPRYRGPYRFWSYAINRAPEHRTAAIPPNTEITSEAIERAGDIDEFAFQASPGAAFMAFLQSANPVQAEMALPNGPPLAIAACQGSDTSLFGRVTNLLETSQAGNYVLRVAGTNPSQIADTGRYRVFLYAIDRRPEHVAAAIPSGVALGEEIDLPGDIDEFTFSGVAGEQVDAFFQAQNGSPDDRLQLYVVDPAGSVLRSIQSTGTDTSLFRQVTGRFALPSTGTYRLRVSGYDGYCARGYRGAYQVFLHRVNGQPETAPDTLAFGDSLSGESIDLPGDFDEFRVTVPDSSGANLAFELQASSPSYPGLIVKLIDATTGQVITAPSGPGGTRTSSGTLSLAPGRYIVRVDASVDLDFSTVRGPYRLWFYRFGLGPEAAPDTFAIGDTVSGEAVEPWGDTDAFHFYGVRGQHVNIALQGLAAPGGRFRAWITGPPNGPEHMFASLESGTSDAALHDHQTRRMDLTASGWYHVTVSGPEGMGSIASRGAYRFAVESLSVAPEQTSSALVPGDSVTSEAIDTPGDWDEFTVTAAPGSEVYATFRGSPFMSIRNPAAGDSLAALNGWQYDKVLGPVTVPAGGAVTIAAYQPASFVRFCYDAACGGVLPFVGPYSFRVFALNRAPETVPAAFAMGDTVRGEAVSPIGDIDEFAGSGAPGETVNVWWHLTADPAPTDGVIWMDVLDAATGVTLGGGYGLIRASQVFYQLGPFVVPAGGYKVRVKAYGLFGDNTATAPYEFVVKRGP